MHPPKGFSPIQGLPFQIGIGRPIFSGSAASIKFYGNPSLGKMWGVVQFKDHFEGPPGYAHGGSQAFILDEAMGTVCWNGDLPVVAKSIQFEFKKPAPLNTDLIVTAEIKIKKGKDLTVASTIQASSENIFTIGSGIFRVITYKQFSASLGTSDMDLSRWFPELK